MNPNKWQFGEGYQGILFMTPNENDKFSNILKDFKSFFFFLI